MMWVRRADRTSGGLWRRHSDSQAVSQVSTRLHLAPLSNNPFGKPNTENIGCTIRPVRSDETRQHVGVSSRQTWFVLSHRPRTGCDPLCRLTFIDLDCKVQPIPRRKVSQSQLPLRCPWKEVQPQCPYLSSPRHHELKVSTQQAA